MRAIIQRTAQAQVEIEGSVCSQISRGLLILLGVWEEDGRAQAEYLAKKCAGLRIFDDKAGKMNLSVQDVDGEILVVSNFTLYGECKKGYRPSFIAAARPETAIPLYEYFVQCLREQGVRRVVTGEFGAEMQVKLQNDGPITIFMDTEQIMPKKQEDSR